MDLVGVLTGVLIGLAVGGVLVWALLRSRVKSLDIENYTANEENKKLTESHTKMVGELAEAHARLERLHQLENDVIAKDKAVDEFREELRLLTEKKAVLEGELISERRSYQERKEELEKAMAHAEETLKASFDSLASKALKTSNETFIQLAKETFEKEQEKARGDLAQRKQSIDEVVKPLAEALKGYEEHLKSLDQEHLKRDTETNERIQQLLTGLSQQQAATHELKGLLRGPSARGRAGEMLLERIFEAAGLTKNLHYFPQLHEAGESGGTRPDFIVKMPGDKEIVIDSKFVLSAYEAAMACEDERSRQDKLKDHAAHVKGHIDALAKRPYVERSKNTELVIMFLPLDACLVAAQEVDSEIATKGWDRRVIVATPSLLFAVMRMVALDWRQENLRANSDEIQKLGKEMVDRIRIAVEHFAGIGDGLDKATRAYNSAVSSIQSQLLTTAHRFQKLEAGKEVKFEPKKLPKTVDREADLFTKVELQTLPGPEIRRQLEGVDSDVEVQALVESQEAFGEPEVVELVED